MIVDVLSKWALSVERVYWSFVLPDDCWPAHVADMWGDRTFRFFLVSWGDFTVFVFMFRLVLFFLLLVFLCGFSN